MPVSTYNFTASPYLKADISLGSFIPQKNTPHKDAKFSSKLQLVEGLDYSKRLDTHFVEDMMHSSHIDFGLILCRIFSGSITRDSSREECLTAGEANLYELKQPRDLFNQLRRQQDIQEWLGDQYDAREHAYFVTGYRTLLDAAEWKKQGNETDGKLQGRVPVELGISLGAATSAMVKNGYTMAREYPGERIFAVQLRKVKLGTFTRKEKPEMGPEAWKFYTEHLGEAPKEEDMVWMEAELSDEDEADGKEGVGFVKVST